MGRGVRMLASRSNQYQTGGKLTLVIIRMQLGISLPLQVVSSSPEILWQAALLKAGYPLSLADAFAAATAMILDAAIITGDPEFRAVADLVEIRWIP